MPVVIYYIYELLYIFWYLLLKLTGITSCSKIILSWKLSSIAQCRNLWLYQQFTTKSIKNTAPGSVWKVMLPNFVCTLASILLMGTTKIVGLESFLKIYQHSQTWPIINMNFSAGCSQIVSLALLGESLWSCPLSLEVWMPASARLRSSSNLKMVTFRGVHGSTVKKFDQYHITPGNFLKDYL